MEIKRLERFLSVIENGSLSAAAKQLGLTQQAVSSSISALEDEIGVRLFERSRGGTTRPTEYGHALVKHARAQFAGQTKAKRELRALRDATGGIVTVGVGEAFAGEIMAKAVARLHNESPEIRINVIEGYSEDLVTRLWEGELDFVAGGTSTHEAAVDLVQDPLYARNDVVAARVNHPLAGKPNVPLKDLQDFTWLVPYSRQSDHDVIVAAFVGENLAPPQKIIGTDAYMIGMSLILANDYLIMTTPGLIGQQLQKRHNLMTVIDAAKPTVRRNACLLYRRDVPMPAVAAALLTEVQRAAAEVSAQADA